jgi:nucleoid DNA-binding protein
MTKKEIARQVALDAGLSQQQALEVVQQTFNEIIRTLATEGRIELRDFGVFEVRRRAARPARNPRTGETLVTPARNVVTFKPGKVMEELVGWWGRSRGGPRSGDRSRRVRSEHPAIPQAREAILAQSDERGRGGRRCVSLSLPASPPGPRYFGLQRRPSGRGAYRRSPQVVAASCRSASSQSSRPVPAGLPRASQR